MKDGGPSSGMRVIASSTGNSLPSARIAVISMRRPSTRAFARGQVAGKPRAVLLAERRRNDDVGQMLADDFVSAVIRRCAPRPD